jgi:hypothetical protein
VPCRQTATAQRHRHAVARQRRDQRSGVARHQQTALDRVFTRERHLADAQPARVKHRCAGQPGVELAILPAHPRDKRLDIAAAREGVLPHQQAHVGHAVFHRRDAAVAAGKAVQIDARAG